MIQIAGAVDDGEVVGMNMLSGKAQQEEALRLARLQTQTLSADEKQAIQLRREANVSRRRDALRSAETAAAGCPLQARIAMRLAAVEKAKKAAVVDEERSSSSLSTLGHWAGIMPTSPSRGATIQHTATPACSWPSCVPTGAFPGLERPRKKRITFSAVKGALDAISDECQGSSASDIQSAQELVAAICDVSQADGATQNLFKPRFSVTGSPSHQAPFKLRGTKRSVDGVKRDATGRLSAGCEAMVANAALTANDDCSPAIGLGVASDTDKDQSPVPSWCRARAFSFGRVPKRLDPSDHRTSDFVCSQKAAAEVPVTTPAATTDACDADAERRRRAWVLGGSPSSIVVASLPPPPARAPQLQSTPSLVSQRPPARCVRGRRPARPASVR